MARPPFVDAHLHLWDRNKLRYPWLEDPAMAAIAPSYDIADYRREAAAWNRRCSFIISIFLPIFRPNCAMKA